MIRTLSTTAITGGIITDTFSIGYEPTSNILWWLRDANHDLVACGEVANPAPVTDCAVTVAGDDLFLPKNTGQHLYLTYATTRTDDDGAIWPVKNIVRFKTLRPEAATAYPSTFGSKPSRAPGYICTSRRCDPPCESGIMTTNNGLLSLDGISWAASIEFVAGGSVWARLTCPSERGSEVVANVTCGSWSDSFTAKTGEAVDTALKMTDALIIDTDLVMGA
jgi:hypothetical protein